jgi:hypothetical protein
MNTFTALECKTPEEAKKDRRNKAEYTHIYY